MKKVSKAKAADNKPPAVFFDGGPEKAKYPPHAALVVIKPPTGRRVNLTQAMYDEVIRLATGFDEDVTNGLNEGPETFILQFMQVSAPKNGMLGKLLAELSNLSTFCGFFFNTSTTFGVPLVAKQVAEVAGALGGNQRIFSLGLSIESSRAAARHFAKLVNSLPNLSLVKHTAIDDGIGFEIYNSIDNLAVRTLIDTSSLDTPPSAGKSFQFI